MQKYEDYSKIIILGGSSVGKTSLISHITNKSLGIDVTTTDGVYYEGIIENDDCIKLAVFDTTNQQIIDSLIRNYSRHFTAVILVIDVTSMDSYNNKECLLRNCSENTKCYVCANKIDLDCQIPIDELEKWAASSNFSFFKTSADDFSSVEPLFQTISEDIIKFHQKRRKENFMSRIFFAFESSSYMMTHSLKSLDVGNYQRDFTLQINFFWSNQNSNILHNFETISIIDETIELKLPRFIADLFYPNVNRLHKIDQVSDHYSVLLDLDILDNKPNKNDSQKYDVKTLIKNFRSFLKQTMKFSFLENMENNDVHLYHNIGNYGDDLENNMDEVECIIKLYYMLLFILGNENFITILMDDSFYYRNIQKENVIDRIHKKQIYHQLYQINLLHANKYQKAEVINEMKIKSPQQISTIDISSTNEEIEFLSSHFYEMEIEELKKLPTNMIFDIVNNEQLCLENESQLYHFVKEMILESDEYYSLFSNINFCYLTKEDISDFVSSFDYEHLSNQIWQQICAYISSNHSEIETKYYLSTIKDTPKRYHDPGKAILFSNESEHSMNGILEYLSAKYCGYQYRSIQKQGIIEITASSSDGNVGYLVLDDDYNFFSTHDDENSWIMFDFKQNQVKLFDYTIHAYNDNYSMNSISHHPKNWVIEISNNKQEWKLIDVRADDSSLNFMTRSSFSVNNLQNVQYSRYIRIRQTGPNWSNDNILQFSSIEFYGKIFEKFDSK